MGHIDVIVVGAPRSGTYWMVDLLNKHFDVTFPSETHFIPLFKRYAFLFGSLKKMKNRRRLLRAMFQFVQLWTPRSGNNEEYIKGIREFSLLSVYDAGKHEWVLENSHDYESLIAALFTAFRDLKGAAGVGDKSAHFLPSPSVKTLNLSQRSKVVHIVRDGRDVAESWKKQWFGPTNHYTAGHLWQAHENAYDQWGKANPQRYKKVSYEDLALDKSSVLKEIEAFLGSSFSYRETGGSENDISKVLAQVDSHSKILSMKADSNLAKWKTFDQENVAQFESVALNSLKQNDYEISSSERKYSRLSHLYGSLRLRTTAHFYKVVVKNNIPLIICIMNFFRVPVETVLNKKFGEIWNKAVKL